MGVSKSQTPQAPQPGHDEHIITPPTGKPPNSTPTPLGKEQHRHTEKF